jgi:TatD DNase family protein
MLIDSHCHLPHKKYEKSTEEIIKEASLAGITKLVTIGTSLEENALVNAVAEKYTNVFCTQGIYPHEDLGKSIEFLRKELEDQIQKSEKIVGVGECGLDVTGWKGGRSVDEQKELFKMQTQLAIDHSLPLIVHNRNADIETFEALADVGTSWLRGVAHCFSSTWETAQAFLDIGFYISFSGKITYPSADKGLLDTVANVPMDRFVLETDAPLLPPQGHRGETNYPKYVKIVAEKVAQVKQKSLEEIVSQSYQNTCELFSFEEDLPEL